MTDIPEIKLIDESTDLSSLTIYPRDWDLVVKGVPYQVIRIEGYVHSIGGRWGNNDLWCYPLDEVMNVHNLAEFSANDPVCWGVRIEPYMYHRFKWDEHEIERSAGVTITRNGIPFDIDYSYEGAMVKIGKYREHALELDNRNYIEKCIGRKVWWRSQPAVVTYFVAGQACVILEPDGIDRFAVPPEFDNTEDRTVYDCDRDIKAHILDAHIWWHRD